MKLLFVWTLFASYAFPFVEALKLFQQPWRADAVPNPMKDPASCGRPKDILHSAVCDPDHIMSTAAQNVVEEFMNNATAAEFAAVLLNRIDTSPYNSDVDEAMKRTAMKMHDAWGVGDSKRQDGVLILISKGDRAVFISAGEGVLKQLSDRTLDEIIRRMKPHLKKSKWDAGFASAIYDVNHTLHHGRVSYTTHDTKSFAQILRELVGIAVIFCIIGLLTWCFASREKKRRTELNKGKDALDRLLSDVKNANHKVYMSSSCPVCLEPFKEETSKTTATNSVTQTQSDAGLLIPKSLPCGHVFCAGCITEFLSCSAKKSCPICRVEISNTDETGEAESNIRTDLNEEHETILTRRRMYRGRRQDLLYRSRRIHEMYPSALDSSTYSSVENGISSGRLSDAARIVESRASELQSQIAEMKRRSQKSKGSRKSSFGGGRSSGGRGGRF